MDRLARMGCGGRRGEKGVDDAPSPSPNSCTMGDFLVVFSRLYHLWMIVLVGSCLGKVGGIFTPAFLIVVTEAGLGCLEG